MKANCLIAVVVSSLFPVSAYAHDCSGGAADGGMDATGNQCNREIAATASSLDRAATSAMRSTQPAPRRPASCTKCAAKGRTAKPNASARPRVKDG